MRCIDLVGNNSRGFDDGNENDGCKYVKHIKWAIMALCIVGLLCTSQMTAFAAGSPPSNPRKVPASTIQCITVTNTGRALDELTAGFSGYAENYTCDSNVTGTLRFYSTTYCNGVPIPGPTYSQSLPVPVGDAVAWSYSVDGWCILCTNGKVTETPPFSIKAYASYSGKDHSNMQVGGTSPTRTVYLSNDPGLLGTSCV